MSRFGMYLYQFNYVLRCPGCDSKLHKMWWHQLPTQESCGYFVCNTCIEFLRRIVKGPWEKFASKRDYRQFPLLSWRRSYYITRAILYKNNHSSAGKVYTNYFPTNTTVNQGPFDGTSVVSSDDVISVSASSDDKDSTTVTHTSAENKSAVPDVDSTSVKVTTSDIHEEMPTDSFVGLLAIVTSGGPPASVTPAVDATSIARAADAISINPAAVETSAVPAVHERILPPVPLFCDRGHNANACDNVTSDVPPASVTPAADVTSIACAPDVISIHPATVNTSIVPAVHVHERILPPVPVPLFCDRGHNVKACATPSCRMLQKQQKSLRPRKRKRKRREILQEQIQVIRTSVHENQTLLMKICLLYTSPSPRDLSTSRMPSSA